MNKISPEYWDKPVSELEVSEGGRTWSSLGPKYFYLNGRGKQGLASTEAQRSNAHRRQKTGRKQHEHHASPSLDQIISDIS